MVKFPTKHGVEKVKHDQIAARECYFNSIRDQSGQKELFTGNIFKTQPPKNDQKLKFGYETQLLVIDE